MSRKNEETQSSERRNILYENSDDTEKLIEQYIGPEKDTIGGVGPFQGGVFQILSFPVVYLITSSLIALVQGLFSTYSNATLSTVEKDFGLSSSLSGLTTTGNDIFQLLLSIPLPFFASRGHRPRWLAFGMFLSSVGCVIAVLPHLLLPSQTLSDATVRIKSSEITAHGNEPVLCSPLNSTELQDSRCAPDDTQTPESHWAVVVILLFAQMLAGVASLLYYTIGHSYMDEAVSKEMIPLFLSISGAMRLLGPVCGYSLASWALSAWKHSEELSDVNLTPSHPRWIGAWWLGYIVIGSVLLSISWVLVLLPKTLPATRKRKIQELRNIALRSQEELLSYVTALRPTHSQIWKDLFPSLRRLASNVPYRLLVMKQIFFWFAFFGYITFKSKYLEHQFRLSAADANRYIAVVSLMAAVVGWVGTGAVISYFKPKPKSIIIYIGFLYLVSGLCYLGQLAVSCDYTEIEGLQKTIWFQNDDREERELISCGGKCRCAMEQYSPVCYNDTLTFYNSCFAKCRDLSSEEMTKDFNNEEKLETKRGFCTPHCPVFLAYIILSVVANMANAALGTPINMLLLRCTEERDKDLGLGIFNAMLALGAFIPAPIFFGWGIDSACILWDNTCDGMKACWLYDVINFKFILHAIPAVFLLMCHMIDIHLLKYAKELELYSITKTSIPSSKETNTLSRRRAKCAEI